MVEPVDHLFRDRSLCGIAFEAARNAVVVYVAYAVIHTINAVVRIPAKFPLYGLLLRRWRIAVETVCGSDLAELLSSQVEWYPAAPRLEEVPHHCGIKGRLARQQSTLRENESIKPFSRKTAAGFCSVCPDRRETHWLNGSAFALADVELLPVPVNVRERKDRKAVIFLPDLLANGAWPKFT